MSNISLPADTYNLFPASPANHVMRFARLPHLSFVIQEVALPTVSATIPRIESNFTSRFSPTRLNFDNLSVTFLVDEEFRAHRELFSWLWGVTGGDDRSTVTQQFLSDQQSKYTWPAVRGNRSEILESTSRTYAGLTIVNAAKIPILRILFYNVFISSLGGVQFSTTADTLTPLTATATFEYEFYTIYEIRR